MTLYEVLGVPPGSTAPEIRQAYLELARAHHPDRHLDGPDDVRLRAARRMQHINQAWNVLGDPARRAAYDRFLASADAPPATYDDLVDDLAEEFSDGRPGASLPRWASVAPAAVFLGGLGSVAASVVLRWMPMFALGAALILLAAVLFVAIPFLAMARSARRHDPRA